MGSGGIESKGANKPTSSGGALIGPLAIGKDFYGLAYRCCLEFLFAVVDIGDRECIGHR